MSATIKLVFTGPWALCVAVALVRSRGDIGPIAVNLLWPFLFFYALAVLLERASRAPNLPPQDRRVWLAAALLVAVDHSLKFAFNKFVPLGESIPVVANRLHLGNLHNLHGTWLTAELGASPVVVQTIVVSSLCIGLAPLIYRFYSERQRRSFWSFLTYGCFVAGNASAAIDLGVRGYIVDYVYLPGLYALDLKDIYLTVFASALFMEAISNPKISVRWLGWREEIREQPSVVIEFARFAVGEIRRIGKGA